MHELSIASSIIEIATEHVEEHNASSIDTVTLRLGALSCVHKDSLDFCFSVISKGTKLEGATLKYIDVPVAIVCDACNSELEPPGVQDFRCPACGSDSTRVVRGKELEIETIEITPRDTAEV